MADNIMTQEEYDRLKRDSMASKYRDLFNGLKQQKIDGFVAMQRRFDNNNAAAMAQGAKELEQASDARLRYLQNRGLAGAGHPRGTADDAFEQELRLDPAEDKRTGDPFVDALEGNKPYWLSGKEAEEADRARQARAELANSLLGKTDKRMAELLNNELAKMHRARQDGGGMDMTGNYWLLAQQWAKGATPDERFAVYNETNNDAKALNREMRQKLGKEMYGFLTETYPAS